MADPNVLRRSCEEAVRTLPSVPGGTPSLRLFADQTAKLLTGMAHVLEALALLVGAPGGRLPRRRGFRVAVPDWLPLSSTQDARSPLTARVGSRRRGTALASRRAPGNASGPASTTTATGRGSGPGQVKLGKMG